MDEHRELWWDSPTVAFGQVVQVDVPEGLTFVRGGSLPGIEALTKHGAHSMRHGTMPSL